MTTDRLEQASAFLTAARTTTEPELRAFYAARARLAIVGAEQEIEVLRVNLKSVEDALPKANES